MNEAQAVFFEVYGIWYNPWWQHKGLYVLLLFFVAGIILYLVRRKYRTGSKLTCDQEALQELHRLRFHSYASQEALHDAYFQLTMIVKNYLAARYKIILQDKSDDQIVCVLHGNLSENMIYLLQEFFDRSFRIKFAYDVVSESMIFNDIEMLQKIVIETSKSAETTGKS
jgi:hypothetical protein